MNNKGAAATVFIIILILFSFALLAGGGYYLLSYEKERQTRVQLEGQLEKIQKEKESVLALLSQSKKENDVLEDTVKKNEQMINDLNVKLSVEVKEKVFLKEEKETLSSAVERMRNEKGAAEGDLQKKIQEIDKLRQELELAQQTKGELEQQLAEQAKILQGQDELETIVVTPSGPSEDQSLASVAETPESQPVQEAALPLESEETAHAQEEVAQAQPIDPLESVEILLVNRQHSFVVLDAGMNQGVEIGTIFDVFHGGSFIGEVEVEKVHDSLSAARFSESFKANEVQESDIAKRSP